jgi:16S rRNA (uracil1498-N3)-methyltransferase
MARTDFRTPRLFVDCPLTAGAGIALDRDATNYLRNVLRLRAGDTVLLFNGRDGEWRAELAESGKRSVTAAVGEQTRTQPPPNDLHYLFAPLKHTRLDYMVQKAVELGASRLQPVVTRHTQVTRVNLDRMRANAIEAAQQCGVLAIPEVAAPATLADVISGNDTGRLLVFCDEEADIADPVTALREACAGGPATMALAVLVGPEGGFADEERAGLLKRPNVVRIALGPRILRADTAGVAALALVQAVLGDWSADA